MLLMLINQYCDVKENEQDLTKEEARQINEMCLKKLQRYGIKCFMSLNCLNLKSMNTWRVAWKKTSSDIWWTARFSLQIIFCFLQSKKENSTWDLQSLRTFFHTHAFTYSCCNDQSHRSNHFGGKINKYKF